jgi:hypothetical protein
MPANTDGSEDLFQSHEGIMIWPFLAYGFAGCTNFLPYNF